MTQKEKLLAVLTELKIEYAIDSPDDLFTEDQRDEMSKTHQLADSTVKIGQGCGYSDFHCVFYFTKDGEFLVHGCWE